MILSKEKIIEYIRIYNRSILPTPIIYGIIETESARHTDSISNSNAVGLMQLTKVAVDDVNLYWKKHFKYENLFNASVNITVGTYLLQRWIETYIVKYPDSVNSIVEYLTIVTYAWGYGNVQKWLNQTKPCNLAIREGMPLDKQEYVDKVYWWAMRAIKEGILC